MSMSSKKRYSYFIGLFIVLIVVLGYIIYITYIKPISITVKPVPEMETITLYFYNPDTDTLKPEQRQVVKVDDLLGKCREIIDELEHGSKTGLVTPIPVTVKVNSVKMQSDGVLHLDLSKELVSQTPEGSSTEITALYAIVNSIAKNIDRVKAVQITIDGRLLQTLETHIEIDQPIIPDYTK